MAGILENVALLARQVTIVATVLALSGSQAVLSACLALCVESMPAAAVPHHGSTEAESVIAAPAAEHHGHHVSPAAPEVTEAAAPLPDYGSAPGLFRKWPNSEVGNRKSEEEASQARFSCRAGAPQGHDRLKGLCGSCCPYGDVTLVAGPRAERADAVARAVAPTTLSWQLPASVGRTVPSLGPPVSPPPPVGALTPLRI